MEREKLNLAHQSLIKSHLRKFSFNFSEYSFANLYLFREVHQYEVVTTSQHHLFVKGMTRDNHYFFMPLTPLENIPSEEFNELASKVDFFFPIPAEKLSYFDPLIYEYDYNRNDSDYIYSSKKISLYLGRHYDGKRNFVNQLLRAHQVDSYPLDKDRKQDALFILDEWKNSLSNGSSHMDDYAPCHEAIELLKELSLKGMIFYVDNQATAFLIGEELNMGTYVIHFAKANRAVPGIYQYMYREFAKSIVDKYPLIDMEQDLGIPGLRKSKESYLPTEIRHKYRVSIRSLQNM